MAVAEAYDSSVDDGVSDDAESEGTWNRVAVSLVRQWLVHFLLFGQGVVLDRGRADLLQGLGRWAS